MEVRGFDHYNLRGTRAELDLLRDFYVTVVGLREGARPPFDSFGYWLYAGDQAVLHLSEVPRPAMAGDAMDRAGAAAAASFNHAAFACSGIRSQETLLRARGIPFRHRTVPLTGQQQLFFADPLGNGVELNFSADDG